MLSVANFLSSLYTMFIGFVLFPSFWWRATTLEIIIHTYMFSSMLSMQCICVIFLNQLAYPSHLNYNPFSVFRSYLWMKLWHDNDVSYIRAVVVIMFSKLSTELCWILETWKISTPQNEDEMWMVNNLNYKFLVYF